VKYILNSCIKLVFSFTIIIIFQNVSIAATTITVTERYKLLTPRRLH